MKKPATSQKPLPVKSEWIENLSLLGTIVMVIAVCKCMLFAKGTKEWYAPPAQVQTEYFKIPIADAKCEDINRMIVHFDIETPVDSQEVKVLYHTLDTAYGKITNFKASKGKVFPTVYTHIIH